MNKFIISIRYTTKVLITLIYVKLHYIYMELKCLILLNYYFKKL